MNWVISNIEGPNGQVLHRSNLWVIWWAYYRGAFQSKVSIESNQSLYQQQMLRLPHADPTDVRLHNIRRSFSCNGRRWLALIHLFHSPKSKPKLKQGPQLFCYMFTTPCQSNTESKADYVRRIALISTTDQPTFEQILSASIRRVSSGDNTELQLKTLGKPASVKLDVQEQRGFFSIKLAIEMKAELDLSERQFFGVLRSSTNVFKIL